MSGPDYLCAHPSCPGYPYRASEIAHPAETCGPDVVVFRAYSDGEWHCESVRDPDTSPTERALEDFAALLTMLFPAPTSAEIREANIRNAERERLAKLLDDRAWEVRHEVGHWSQGACAMEEAADLLRRNPWRTDKDGEG